MVRHAFPEVGRIVAALHRALEELFPSVSGHVDAQFAAPGEACLALIAHERPQVQVGDVFVAFQVARILVGTPTLGALVRPLARVVGLMLLER